MNKNKLSAKPYALERSVSFQRNSSKAQGPADSNLLDCFHHSQRYRVRWRGRLRALRFLRISLSSLLNSESSKLNELHLWLLYEVYSRLSAETDYCFLVKYQEDLTRISYLVRQVIKFHGSLSNTQVTAAKIYFKTFPSSLINYGRAHFGELNLEKVEHWVSKTNRYIKTKTPEARYIGVGYRDQGTCRRPERNGTPSWQEVASATNQVIDSTGLETSVYNLYLTHRHAWDYFNRRQVFFKLRH
jgi:hypothetical protein